MIGIYTIPTLTHSQNSLAAEALSLKISSHGTSLKWSWRPSQPAGEQSKTMQWNGASPFEFDGKSIEIETKIWSEIPNGGKDIVRTNTCIRRKNEIQKSMTLRVTVWDQSRKVNPLSKITWDHQVYKFYQNRLASPYDGR